VLRKVFRGKFVDALKQAFRDGQLCFHGDLTLLGQPKTFAAWLRPLHRKDWVWSRFTDGKVTFRWRDYAHNNEQKLMTLSLDEFLRRFLLHLLPESFVRIRNFGLLAHRKRTTTLPLCFQLLGSAPQTEQAASSTNDASQLWLCPKCGGPMLVIERLTAAEIHLRSPPLMITAAGTLRASARFVALRLAAEPISSSRFSTLSVSGRFALLPAPVLSSKLRRTASAYLDAPPSLH